ncbi:zinc finger HIT domain-containing protein 3 isoform X2 [Rhynchophorus ferrugineus]|uniref:zinc finger HIT domain-containing protein 3 isoform X2 n=1 Tax=Rhynchophorus ferrugineus TaxID=354439 RepID=UPI003FCCE63B
MNKVCIICSGNGIYKCPTCFIYYCSAKCCKKHRENDCELFQKEEQPVAEEKPKENVKTADEVSAERLQLLKNSDEVKNLLTNPHLRDLLVTIDQAENAEQIMQKAMLEAIFVEFADACIKAVEPPNSNPDQAAVIMKSDASAFSNSENFNVGGIGNTNINTFTQSGDIEQAGANFG